MMTEIKIELPDRKETIRWLLEDVNPQPAIRPLAQRIGLETEGIMKEVVQISTKTGGPTAASIKFQELDVSKEVVTIGVGSWIRGHILRWLDRGRREVFPVRRRALRFWIRGEKIFAQRSRPAPPKFIFSQTLERLWSRLDNIVNEVKSRNE